MARPRKKIDPEQVKQLAAINCSYAEMAAVLGCDESTLTRRFAQVIRDGRASGRMTVKRAQWKLGIEKLNCSMLIWLGKQLLKQRDLPLDDSDDETSAAKKIKLTTSWAKPIFEVGDGDGD